MASIDLATDQTHLGHPLRPSSQGLRLHQGSNNSSTQVKESAHQNLDPRLTFSILPGNKQKNSYLLHFERTKKQK